MKQTSINTNSQVVNNTQQINTANQPLKNRLKDKEELKKKLNYLRDKDREMVKGIFHFYEVPGGIMSFVYKFYKEDPVERYDLVDGEIYSLPLGVAKHLNKNCWYPEYEYVKAEGTHNPMRIGRRVRRCSFQSLEFIDIDEFTTNVSGTGPLIEQPII